MMTFNFRDLCIGDGLKFNHTNGDKSKQTVVSVHDDYYRCVWIQQAQERIYDDDHPQHVNFSEAERWVERGTWVLTQIPNREHFDEELFKI